MDKALSCLDGVYNGVQNRHVCSVIFNNNPPQRESAMATHCLNGVMFECMRVYNSFCPSLQCSTVCHNVLLIIGDLYEDSCKKLVLWTRE